MRWTGKSCWPVVAVAFGLNLIAGVAFAADPGGRDADIQRLEAEIQTLREAIQADSPARSRQTGPQVAENTAIDDWNGSAFHLAGYVAAGYTDSDNGTGAFSPVTLSPILLFQYRDLVLLDAELEIEVGEDGATSTNLEYASVNFFINDYVTLISGKFLSPLGQFKQNLHPAWINKLASAPPGFGHDGAAPDAEVGVQLRGAMPVGAMRVNYAVYAGNGPELEAEGGEIHGVVAKGVARDQDGTKVWGGRVGVLPLPNLELGLSAAMGKATVTDNDAQAFSGDPNRGYDAFGADFAYQWRPVEFRGEYIRQKIEDAATSVAPQGGAWEAWYVQGAYKFAKDRIEAVLRYGDINSPHAEQEQQQWALGLNYLFSPSALVKATYEFNDNGVGAPTGDDRWIIQVTYAY